MKKLISVLILTALLPTLLFADTIYLKSGKTIKGKIVEADSKSLTIKTETGRFRIDREDIEKIEVKDEKVIEKTAPKEKPEEKGEENKGTYYQGKKDGEIAGRTKNLMVMGGAAGCCIGPIGYAFIPMAGTEPPYEKMELIKQKSEEYKRGYRDGYKGKQRIQFIIGVSLGWAVTMAVLSLMVQK